jgi:hypothetical protein
MVLVSDIMQQPRGVGCVYQHTGSRQSNESSYGQLFGRATGSNAIDDA